MQHSKLAYKTSRWTIYTPSPNLIASRNLVDTSKELQGPLHHSTVVDLHEVRLIRLKCQL